MALRRDPMLRVVRRLTLLCAAVLFDLDAIWGLGTSPAGWLVRVAFNALLLCGIVISRGDIDRIRLDDAVIARASGTRDHFWEGVAVLFTATRVVALCRSVIAGRNLQPLGEAPLSTVQLHHERHGAFHDRVRCDWPDGTVMQLRVRRHDMQQLAQYVDSIPRPRGGPFARTIDWVRAGTTYEE